MILNWIKSATPFFRFLKQNYPASEFRSQSLALLAFWQSLIKNLLIQVPLNLQKSALYKKIAETKKKTFFYNMHCQPLLRNIYKKGESHCVISRNVQRPNPKKTSLAAKACLSIQSKNCKEWLKNSTQQYLYSFWQ